MREILFRGKRKDTGAWVFGDLVHSQYKIGGTCVGQYGNTVGIHQVNPETVGQFTGLTDKNGKKIFDGDILEFNSRIVNIASGLPTGGNCTERSVVEWGGHRWNRKRIYHSQWNSNWTNYGFTTDLYPENAAKYAEIIGTIHDNPELLEVPHE